jgi:hypothetical protein
MAEPKPPAKPQEKKPEAKAVVKQIQEFYFGVSACCLLDT